MSCVTHTYKTAHLQVIILLSVPLRSYFTSRASVYWTWILGNMYNIRLAIKGLPFSTCKMWGRRCRNGEAGNKKQALFTKAGIKKCWQLMAGNKKALNENPRKTKNAKINKTRKRQRRKPAALRAETDEWQQEENRERRSGRADVGKQVKWQRERERHKLRDTRVGKPNKRWVTITEIWHMRKKQQ